MAGERNDYSGCPIPLDGQRLVVEPTFKYKGLGDVGKEEFEPVPEGFKVRNTFWSHKYRCHYAICEEPDGKVWGTPFAGSGSQANALLLTLGASDVWGIEQESNATQLLGTMLRHRQFKQYLLTGMFLEKSERSGVTYLFRKLRPTVALSSNTGHPKVLACLCLHPIAYYEGSWAGAMTPTDDVVAHLAMCRGDEKMFWKRSAQHNPRETESGL